MAEKLASRKWQLTFNNPVSHGYTHQHIKDILNKDFSNLLYWCMGDEIGNQGKTPHTHLFVQCSNAIRFDTMKKRFPGAHLEIANGTAQQNRDYIRKEGKWEKDKKKETNLPETFEEFGEMPVERPGQRNDLWDLYDMIKSGYDDYDILEANPEYMLNLDKIDRARQTLREKEFRTRRRLEMQVTFVSGTTGTGKTRDIMDEFGDENVFRITEYDNLNALFDGYRGQDVVVFEEFRNSLKCQAMLNYLDVYPLQLPARYNKKVACYTKVFIVTNEKLEEQYMQIQKDHPETWEAFLRRIHRIKIYSPTGIEEYSTMEYMSKKGKQLLENAGFEIVETSNGLPFTPVQQELKPDKNGDYPF